MTNKKTLWLLLLILLLASFLRIYNIGSESFWIDEGSTAMTLKYHNSGDILRNIYDYGGVLPEYYKVVSDLPVYYYTLSYWSQLFSISEVSLRMFSALFGVLSIIPVFFIAKELFGKKTALLSSFLFAISIPAIEFSQEARLYTLFLFLGLASTYFFIKSLKENKIYYWSAYIAATILGLYTYLIFGFLLIFHMLYIIFYLTIIKGFCIREMISKLFKKSIFSRIFIVFLIIMLLSGPLILISFKEGHVESWWEKPNLGQITKNAVKFSTWIYPSIELREKIKTQSFFEFDFLEALLVLSVALTAILSYSLILFLVYSRLRKLKLKNFVCKDKSMIFLLGWFGFPVFAMLFAAVFTQVNLFVGFHHLIHSLPPFIILLSKGMLNIKPKYFKVTLVFFLVISILPLYSYYSNVDKQQWREVSEYVKPKATDDELIIISLFSGQVPFRYYYGDNENIHGVRTFNEDTIELIKDKESVWFILSFLKYYDPKGSIKKYINKNYDIIERTSFFDIEVYHLQKKEMVN
jgi:uncharacterized membrane protein